MAKNTQQKFQWTIANFAGLKAQKLYSEIFIIGGHRWRILLFPKGNGVDSLSLYLDVADSVALPVGWTTQASFTLSVVDQVYSTNTITKRVNKHIFCAKESDWGFTSFMKLSEFHDHEKGYIVNGSCIIEAEVSVHAARGKKNPRLHTCIKVARDEDLAQQIGKDRYFDLVDFDHVRSFRMVKQTPFIHFKEEVAEAFGIPVPLQRFWIWAWRQNNTYRPLRPLTSFEEAKCVEELQEKPSERDRGELRVFLEVALNLDLHPVALPVKTEKDILLFFKFYEPGKESLRYVGRFFVKGFGKPRDILSLLNQMAGLDPDDEIELYEEIKFEPLWCELIDKELSYESSQLEDGDIICFQKTLFHDGEDHPYPDVPSFFKGKVGHLCVSTHAICTESVDCTSEDALVPVTEVIDLKEGSNSEAFCIGQRTASSLSSDRSETSENPTGELVDFMGMGKIEKAFVPLLEEVCSWHPFLIECQKKRSQLFTQWAFTALSRVLHFLKTTKGRDMTETACEKLQVLWEELETCLFDLSWLEPHVYYAFGMKTYMENAQAVKKLKDNVTNLEVEAKELKVKLGVAERNLEVARKELAKALEEFAEKDLDMELGYGGCMPCESD